MDKNPFRHNFGLLTMKFFGLLFLVATNLVAFGQNEDQAFKKIDKIFGDYIKQKENVDSEDNQVEMQLALKTLESNCDTKYLPKLIEVWMYYDPTDFPTRKFVHQVLLTKQADGLKAIERRIKEKKNWETLDNAPLSDLVALRDEFKKLTNQE